MDSSDTFHSGDKVTALLKEVYWHWVQRGDNGTVLDVLNDESVTVSFEVPAGRERNVMGTTTRSVRPFSITMNVAPTEIERTR
jgi:hypothetical protein